MAESVAPAPVFEIIAQSFKVTLFPSGGVNDLLTYIKDNPGKKSKEIKSALNLTQRTLERWLKELRIQNKIRFQGAPKTGGYFPVDDT
jgi:ATP-dependent DNA helicase RecG